MKQYAFSQKGLDKIQSFMSTHSPLLAFDIDGTLSALVDKYEDARVSQDILFALNEVSLYQPVAIITGRSLDSAKKILHPFMPQYIVGNHGCEGASELTGMQGQLLPNWNDILNGIDQILERKIPYRVENKIYTITLHFRENVKIDMVYRQIKKVLSPLLFQKCIWIHGVRSINIVPRGFQCTKATALDRILNISHKKYALYCGDDMTDETVFSSYPESDVLGIHIGISKHSSASLFLYSQKEMERLVQYMLSILR